MIILRREGIQLLYGLTLLALWLYGYIEYQTPPQGLDGIAAAASSWTQWVSQISLVLGLLVVMISIYKAIRFRLNVFAHRAEFEHLVANKETLVTSDNREIFNIMCAMMAYEYERERSFYDANLWRDQLLMLTHAIVKMVCFVLLLMIGSLIVSDQWLPGVGVGIACLPPWLLLGAKRPRNLFVHRAERAGSIVLDELNQN